jgi:thymidine phosphorylase
MESIDCLEGKGPADLLEVTLVLSEEVARLSGSAVTRTDLERALAEGRAREHFDRWAVLQGADPAWLRAPRFELAPAEHPIRAPRSGRLAGVATRDLGLLLVEAGAGRSHPGAALDHGVSLRVHARLGQEVAAGEEIARLYLRRADEALAARCAGCFTVAGQGEAPPLILEQI